MATPVAAAEWLRLAALRVVILGIAALHGFVLLGEAVAALL